MRNFKITVIGLGYVGLPLALAFSKKQKVIGFDINKKRVNDLNLGIDVYKDQKKKRNKKKKKF